MAESQKAGYMPHEASHRMKQEKYTPYAVFVAHLPEKINMSSENTAQKPLTDGITELCFSETMTENNTGAEFL